MYHGKTRVTISLTLPNDEYYCAEQESFVGDNASYDSEKDMLFNVFSTFLKTAELADPKSHFLPDELTFNELLFLSKQLIAYRKNEPEETK